ncbi:CBS domain containing protein [Methanonatronarchaeum thermophilum]|uniref:CBS domain containing protein n=1 Tax=Methanonatronarchaeum thermophilum TaxID=1927129 RepID=A0A1Y3GET2_9EURY|nr:CBS domain-containing protein [Methanonatronarchaeum thermophilum]OUJ18694.1 CBS domain containing protein [Methanonatronarchaeum thermophilum]
MKVKKVMENSPLYVKESDFITKARQVLRDNQLRALPVIDDNDNVSGVLTRDGVLKVTSNKSNVTVKGFTKNIDLLTPENTIEDAGKLILEYNIDSIPITKTRSNRVLVGVVNIHDLFNSISNKQLNPEKKVVDIMNPKVETAEHNEQVSSCWRRMLNTGLSGFPVLKNDRLIGIITKGDVIQAGHARFSRGGKTSGGSTDKTKITRLMSTPVTTVSPETQVKKAFEKMKNKNIGRLPVVKDDTVVGIVDRYDVLKPYLG